jgi:hypothetical protein
MGGDADDARSGQAREVVVLRANFKNRLRTEFSSKIKVAIYKYHTNKFVYKNEGVGAMAEQSDQIGKNFHPMQDCLFWTVL